MDQGNDIEETPGAPGGVSQFYLQGSTGADMSPTLKDAFAENLHKQ